MVTKTMFHKLIGNISANRPEHYENTIDVHTVSFVYALWPYPVIIFQHLFKYGKGGVPSIC